MKFLIPVILLLAILTDPIDAKKKGKKKHKKTVLLTATRTAWTQTVAQTVIKQMVAPTAYTKRGLKFTRNHPPVQMASDLQTLIEFGFPEYKAKKALKVTNNSGLQPALDWLEANGEDEANFAEDNEEATAAKAKTCLMCNACKKKFTTLEQAELHAARTSHDDFAEAAYEAAELDTETCNEPIPELTKEQKAARLEELRAKLALKKAAKEKEAKEAETLRKASAKELEQVRREMQAKEMKKLAEERRLEKIADKKRREEIKLQIEEDRINKKRQIEAEKAKLAGGNVNDNVNSEIVASAVMTDAPVASTNSSNSNCARIQVRLPAPNAPLKLTFDSPATQTLKDLKERIKAECPAVKSVDELMQTFPTRVFGKAEDGCTLNELGLAPSASLILK